MIPSNKALFLAALQCLVSLTEAKPFATTTTSPITTTTTTTASDGPSTTFDAGTTTCWTQTWPTETATNTETGSGGGTQTDWVPTPTWSETNTVPNTTGCWLSTVVNTPTPMPTWAPCGKDGACASGYMCVKWPNQSGAYTQCVPVPVTKTFTVCT